MDLYLLYVVGIILVALVFWTFLTALKIAANSIATVVATRVLTPRKAVIWAAFFNFVAAFGFGTHVAGTIGKGLVRPDVVDPNIVLAALLAAIAWTVICLRRGLPISVSHALIGALAGVVLVKGGLRALSGAESARWPSSSWSRLWSDSPSDWPS